MLIKTIFSFLQKKSSQKKVDLIIPFLKSRETVLDFGCGDLSFAKELLLRNKNLSITGIDVVDFKESIKGIIFKKYNGEKIPFKSNSFDTVISLYVFHHCQSAVHAFTECLRVAKKRVIIVEAVARNKREIPLMKFIDWLANTWKKEDIPVTYQFLTLREWRKTFKKLHVTKVAEKSENSIISFLPIGRMYIFEVYKK